MLAQLAGGGFALLGIAYLVVPQKVYHFGPDFFRDTQSEPSEPGDFVMWTYRFIGCCLIVMDLSHMF